VSQEQVARNRFLLPIGGDKGAGPAQMNGAAIGRDVVDFNGDDGTTTNTGRAIVALSISSCCDPAVL